MKKAFTLVEMLVVIGIIGILVATMAGLFRGSTDKARMVKCAANMKSLAMAVGACAMSSQYYPYAQSAQEMGSSSASEDGVGYTLRRGWIHYLDDDTKYPLSSPGSFAQPSFASEDEDEISYAITNGAIWQAVGKVRDVYTCPAHVAACKRVNGRGPAWSYQMNAWFGYEENPGEASATAGLGRKFGELTIHVKKTGHDQPLPAERILLFAEIPAIEKAGLPPVHLSGDSGSPEMDGCLLYESTEDGKESIGFNHISGKDMVGHVAFVDGHVEALFAPKGENPNFVKLTDWLCRGLDCSFDGNSYQVLYDPEEK